jgi:hypothetical protein
LALHAFSLQGSGGLIGNTDRFAAQSGRTILSASQKAMVESAKRDGLEFNTNPIVGMAGMKRARLKAGDPSDVRAV